jgi:hypothetical protein
VGSSRAHNRSSEELTPPPPVQTNDTHPRSSLLDSVLFLMAKDKRECFLATASAEGVAYVNRVPTYDKPISLELSGRAQKGLEEILNTAGQNAGASGTEDNQVHADALAVLKADLEAGARLSLCTTKETPDELRQRGKSMEVQSRRFLITCRLHAGKTTHDGSLVATYIEPLPDARRPGEPYIKSSWDIHSHSDPDLLHVDAAALERIVSELSYDVRSQGLTDAAIARLITLRNLIELSQSASRYRYELESRQAGRLTLRIQGPPEVVSGMKSAFVYVEKGDLAGSAASGQKSTEREESLRRLRLLLERVDPVEEGENAEGLHRFTCSEDKATIPPSGFVVDRGMDSQLRKQLEAIAAVRKGGGDKVLHLMKLAVLVGKSGLSGLEPYSCQVDSIEFIDKDLTERQREAVVSAMSTPDVCLIHGPPGTGKTRVIGEIVQQAARRGWKTLLVAPTHPAVDNVLERVGDRDDINPVRCVTEEKRLNLSDPARQFTYKERIETLPAKCGRKVEEDIAWLSERRAQIDDAVTMLRELPSHRAQATAWRREAEALGRAQRVLMAEVRGEFKHALTAAQAAKEMADRTCADFKQQLETAQCDLEKAAERARRINSESYAEDDRQRLEAAEAEVNRIEGRHVVAAQAEQNVVRERVAARERTMAQTQTELDEACAVLSEMAAGTVPAKVRMAIQRQVERVSAEHDSIIGDKDHEVQKAKETHRLERIKADKLTRQHASARTVHERLLRIQTRPWWKRLGHATWWKSFFIAYPAREAACSAALQSSLALLPAFQSEVEQAESAARQAREMKMRAMASVEADELQMQHQIYESRRGSLPAALNQLALQLAQEKSEQGLADRKVATAQNAFKEALQTTRQAIQRQLRREGAVELKEARRRVGILQIKEQSARQALSQAQESVAQVESSIAQAIEQRGGPLGSQIQQLDLRIRQAEQAVDLVQGTVARLVGRQPLHTPAEIESAVERLLLQIPTMQKHQAFLNDWREYVGRESGTLGQRLAGYLNVVCATTVGIASDDYFGDGKPLEQKQFDLLIVDEAGKVTESEFLVAAARAKRWVLLGDHKQLPPYYDQRLDRFISEANKVCERTGRRVHDPEPLRKSFFETLWQEFARDAQERPNRTDPRRVTLNVQRRMHPDLAQFLSNVFYGPDYTSPDDPAFVQSKSIDLSHFGRPVTFIEVCPPRNRRGWEENLKDPTIRKRLKLSPSTGYANLKEAEQAVQVLEWLVTEEAMYAEQDQLERNNDRVSTIGIIAFYKGQVELIRRLIVQNKAIGARPDSEGEFLCAGSIRVAVKSVDAFQGRECPIIILSFTRSNHRQNVGFVDDPNRLNVAMSRARKRLILLGDTQTLVHRSKARDGEIEEGGGPTCVQAEHDFFLKLVKYIEDRGVVMKYFQMRKMNDEAS